MAWQRIVCGLQLMAVCLVSCGLSVVADDYVARRAGTVLRKHCYRCHGQTLSYPGLDFSDPATFVEPASGEVVVIPGDLSNSQLWQVISEDRMPPKDQNDYLSTADKEAIRTWIEQGAKAFPQEKPRQFIAEEKILQWISQDLSDLELRGETLLNQKYFSIAHLHNNPLVSESDLRIHRAALSKSLNMMSRSRQITVPEAIDADQTVFRVNLEDYGWDVDGLWSKVLRVYPYGLKPRSGVRRQLYDRIARTLGEDDFDGIPYLRADWFVATATRPPLYHDLLDIPATLAELDRRLDVDVKTAFQKNQLLRAGMFRSGVSTQNRMVERNNSASRMYWISYDFEKDTGRANLARFPLGPKFEGNPHNQFAFDYDGGEVIFELPNRLHGYMLVTSAGNRIDAGPITIVYDKRFTSGSPAIVTGLSCMNCHRHGLLPLEQNVREGHAVKKNAQATQKVENLYATKENLQRVLERDNTSFQAALTEVLGPFLLQGEDANLTIKDFEDPVSLVTLEYNTNLSLQTAASELGVVDVLGFKRQLDVEVFSGLGIQGLIKGGTVKRGFWGGTDAEVNSIFQDVADQLGVGSPVGR